MSEAHVPSDINMPGLLVGEEVIVMPMGLIGDAVRATEMDPAGNRIA
jgi:hypothetical protein